MNSAEPEGDNATVTGDGSDTLENAIAAVKELWAIIDDEQRTHRALRKICMNATPHPALTRQYVEVLGRHSNPQWLIAFAAHICDGESSGVELFVDLYKELLAHDRGLLIPVIESLGQLPLSENAKSQALAIVQDALASVDEENTLPVVKALLSTICVSTVGAVIRSLRKQYSSLPTRCTPHVVEMLGSTLRVEPKSASTFLQILRAEQDSLSTIDVATLIVLASRRNGRQPILLCFKDMVEQKRIRTPCVRDLIEQRHVALLDASYAPTWLKVVRYLQEHEQSCAPAGLVVEQIYLSLFAAHGLLRAEIIEALVSDLTLAVAVEPALKRHRTARSSAMNGGERKHSLQRTAQLLMLLESRHGSLLNEHVHLIEETVLHSYGDPVAYGYLCCLAAKLAKNNERLLSSLIIFCRKSSFGHDARLQRSAVLVAAFLLELSACTLEEQNGLLLLVLRACLQHPLNSSIQELCELLHRTLQKFDDSLLQTILHDHLLPTLQRPIGLQKSSVVHTKPCVAYIESNGADAFQMRSFSGIQIPIVGWVKQYHRGHSLPPQVFVSSGEQHSDLSDQLVLNFHSVLRCISMVEAKMSLDTCTEFSFAMPAKAFDFLRHSTRQAYSSNIVMELDVSSESCSELVEIAWCCYYAAVAARSLVCSMESCNSNICLQMMAFSQRWLTAGHLATQRCSDITKPYVLRHRETCMSVIPVQILTGVLSHVGPSVAMDPDLLVSLYSCLFEQISFEGSVVSNTSQMWLSGTPLLHGLLEIDRKRSILHCVQSCVQSWSDQRVVSSHQSIIPSGLLYQLIVEQLNVWAQVAEQCRQHPDTGMTLGKVVVRWRQSVHILCYLWKILTSCLESACGSEKHDLIEKISAAIVGRELPSKVRRMTLRTFSMETVYRFIVAHFESACEAHCAALALESLVALTRGVRKSEEVAKLHARFLQTIYPRTDAALNCFISKFPLAVTSSSNWPGMPLGWPAALMQLCRMMPKCADNDVNVCTKRLTWHCTITLCALVQSHGMLLDVAADFVRCLDLLFSQRDHGTTNGTCCRQLPALTFTTAPLIGEAVMQILRLCQPVEASSKYWLQQKIASATVLAAFASLVNSFEDFNSDPQRDGQTRKLAAALTASFLKHAIRDLDDTRRSLTDGNIQSWPTQSAAKMALLYWRLVNQLRELCGILKRRDQHKAKIAIHGNDDAAVTDDDDDAVSAVDIAKSPSIESPIPTSAKEQLASIEIPIRNRSQALLPRATFAIESFTEYLTAMIQRHPDLWNHDSNASETTKNDAIAHPCTPVAAEWSFLTPVAVPSSVQHSDRRSKLGITAEDKMLNKADGYDSSSTDDCAEEIDGDGCGQQQSSLEAFRAEARSLITLDDEPKETHIWGAS
eukprot:SAG31_NODE_3018_length_4784_cov_4.682604_1_plen_1376_part_00